MKQHYGSSIPDIEVDQESKSAPRSGVFRGGQGAWVGGNHMVLRDPCLRQGLVRRVVALSSTVGSVLRYCCGSYFWGADFRSSSASCMGCSLGS